jgi:hypothetical protein
MERSIVFRLALVLFAILFALFFASCDGDGGDDADGGAQPATITEQNFNDGVQFIVDTIPGCNAPNAAPGGVAAVRNAMTLTPDWFEQLQLDRVLRAVGVDITRQTSLLDLAGSCGGTLTLNFTEDEGTGNFSGQLVADNFCEEADGSQTTLNGSATFSGNTNESTGALTLDAMTDGLTVADGGEVVTISFDVSASGTEDTLGLTGGITIAENGDAFSLENIDLTATTMDSTLEIAGSLQFVDPDEGTVDITIIEPLTISDAITSGQIEVEGAGGTTIMMNVTNDNVFEFLGDADGDGQTDDFMRTVDCSTIDIPDIDLGT